MKDRFFGRRMTAIALLLTMCAMPLAAIAQTPIKFPKNKYKVQDDIKLGNDASRQVERQFPVLADADATNYVERVGQRLVSSIPAEFKQPAFDYRFKVVNARDINAFALPGGPMYVNRGMIEAARNEGEMAGVMAHEISHVALRHATAQATKQSSAKSTLGMLGMIIGGAIIGGEAGAQLGMLGAAAWMTKYSREYETQADLLGARIMADAGYDPRDLANMFKTIAGERSGGGAPEWLSSHPDPGNRYEKINREAGSLRVSSNPIKITRDFERIQAKFRAMPRARTMAEIEKGYKDTQVATNPTASGQYSNAIQLPSTRVRAYAGSSWVRLNVPSNWRDFPSQDSVQFAPEGAYGSQGITRGAMIGIYRGQTNDLRSATDAYVDEVLQGNSYLRQQNSPISTSVGGRTGYTTQASGRSPITNRTEVVTIYTTRVRSGELFYLVTVVPSDESYSYNSTFRNILNSIRFSD